MTFRDRLAQLDRLQNARIFKIVASCVIVALALAGIVSYVVAQHTPAARQDVSASAPAADNAKTGDAPESQPRTAEEAEAAAREKAIAESERNTIEASRRAIDQILAARSDATSVSAGIALIAAVALIVVWLGLALTYLALGVAFAAIVVPLHYLGLRDFARLSAGVVALTAAFLALLQGARVALSGPGPVWAVARNVLIESVRMKVSLVMIVVLIVGLAVLPGVLSDQSPLRYRVQSFLSFGTGGSFWLIAILTLLFACASMAYEQREKVIWQTMTKPVAAWQYILGKWLGLVTLNAVLLTVCAAAVFLFTEYLRSKPAIGEQEAYVARGSMLITEDRYALETQILASRVRSYAEPPELDRERFAENVNFRIQQEIARSPEFKDTPETRRKIEEELFKSAVQAYRRIPLNESQVYVFTGLGEARDLGVPLTFRYSVDSGSNRPDVQYRIAFSFAGTTPTVENVALGTAQTIPILPTVIDQDGLVAVEVYNGDPFTGRINAEEISFPANGLELSYSVGSYRWNFVRVMGVLWLKLAFLAMIAVFAGTFMSFPVACLISFSIFFMAEGAGFLSTSLEYFSSIDEQGKVNYFAVVVRAIGLSVAWIFKLYAELKPTEKLVEGLRLSWTEVAVGTLVLAGATLALFASAVFVFRRRELAIYSGQ